MCLILFAYKVHPKYPLLVAANRDEFYNRKTAEAHYWMDYPEVLGGRDLEQMGTWMGITKHGRFSSLTNYRDPTESKENRRSRGFLVRDFLTSQVEPETYLKTIQYNKENYQGFNLLVGTAETLWYYSNIENQIRELNSGIYGLSNHFLNTQWPKVEKGIKGISSIIEKGKFEPEEFFQLLTMSDPAPEHLLPNTGVSKELESQLSPLFINMGYYGTRTSTILTINHENTVHFIERTYDDKQIKNNEFTFYIKTSKS